MVFSLVVSRFEKLWDTIERDQTGGNRRADAVEERNLHCEGQAGGSQHCGELAWKSRMNVLDLQTEGTFEEQAAERAPLAAFHWSNVHDARSNPPLLMIRSWGRELQLYRNLARYLGPQQPIVTIAPPRGEVPLDFPRTVETWRDFCLEQMQPLLDSPCPLRIGGWSFGGVLALEVARRLETEGKQVERVVMLDTRLPKAHAEDVARELMRALS